MFSLLLVSLFSAVLNVLAAPAPLKAAAQSVSLHRRSTFNRTEEDWSLWAKNQREGLMAKYGGASPPQKRSFGTNLITNQNADSSFFGSMAVGSPPTTFEVILDTGSSDLWVADASCTLGCEKTKTFDPSSSSSFQNFSSNFAIQYGSGQAAGVLGQDVIQMAGFTVPNQVFAVCDEVSDGLLQSPVSGLMGLGFANLAQSGATPFWQTLASSGVWDSPVMAFHLTRFVDDPTARSVEPGGSFTMGFIDQTLYDGDIEFINIPKGHASYWLLPLNTINIQGTAIPLQNDSSSFAAIDTGTTLVGGPENVISTLFSQIPGSAPATGNYKGYWSYPCETSIDISLNFGGSNWQISNADFQLKQMGDGQCLGAFFALSTGNGAPNWIIGDTFLKNVYSVFRFSPPSVGFAALSSTAMAQNDAQGDAPTPTIASVAATAFATGHGNSFRETNSARQHKTSSAGIIGVTVVAVITSLLHILL
jgi:cathepsin D